MSIVGDFIKEYELDIMGIECRYGGYYYLFLGRNINLLLTMDDFLNGGDLDGTSMISYLDSDGAWLPFGIGKNYDQAALALEKKILETENHKKWFRATSEFYDWFVNFFDKSCAYSIDIERRKKNSPLHYSVYTELGELLFDDDGCLIPPCSKI